MSELNVGREKVITFEEAAARLFNTPLMARPANVRTFTRLFEERLQTSGFQAVVIPAAEPAAAMGLGDGGARKPYGMSGDGVAVIEVSGTLVNRYGWAEGCGFTSYEYLRAQLEFAANDKDCKAVVLRIESPGGECGGAFTLADYIFNFRQKKPIYAVADDYAYSAGYLLFSQCTKGFVTPTSGVGSIGVIAQLLDMTEFDKKMGLQYHLIRAGEKKAQGHPHGGISEDAIADLRVEVDRLYGLFVDAVVRGRGLTEAAVRKTEAACISGPDAVKLGLADGIASVHEVIGMITDGALTKTTNNAGLNLEVKAGIMTMAHLNSELALRESINLAIKEIFTKREAAAAEPLPIMPVDEPTDDPEDEDEDQDDVEYDSKTDFPSPAATVEEDTTKEQTMEDNTQTTNAAELMVQATNKAKLIVGMAQLAGQQMDPAWLDMSVEEVQAKLLEARAKAEPAIGSAVKSGAGAGVNLNAIENEARKMSIEGNLTYEQAYTRLLAANPQAYAEYDRQHKVICRQ